ncbi:MAG: hypothetical protein ACKO3C_03730 [Betaproteobacteria bacterium]|nr:hypothetical protein [Betaproteobacteria bacterium]
MGDRVRQGGRRRSFWLSCERRSFWLSCDRGKVSLCGRWGSLSRGGRRDGEGHGRVNDGRVNNGRIGQRSALGFSDRVHAGLQVGRAG